MRVIEKIEDVKVLIKEQKSMGRTIGLVPTMGYLHRGHASLIEKCSQSNDFSVVSIFVNPIQFGANEDFGRYPRDIERDCRLAQAAGADMIFAPSAEEMYPRGCSTFVDVEGITEKLCGRSRPGHFRGVTTVVSKLFNIVEPDNAYFGQKDAQQAIVIKKMTRDLNMNVRIITCPIVREEDGLAMSSRNVYLDAEQREAALVLSRSLFNARDMIQKGERSKHNIIEYLARSISAEKLTEIDYISILDATELEEIPVIQGRVLIAAAVKFGGTRLIDNVMVEV